MSSIFPQRSVLKEYYKMSQTKREYCKCTLVGQLKYTSIGPWHTYTYSQCLYLHSPYGTSIYIYIDSTFGVASLPLSLCQSHSVQILAPSTVGRLRQAGRCSDKKGQFQVTLCQDVWIKYLKGKRHWLILHWWKSIAIRTMLQDIHFDYYSISIFVCKSVQRHIYTHTCARPPLCLSLSLY